MTKEKVSTEKVSKAEKAKQKEKLSKQKEKLPALIRDELRRTIALHNYAQLFTEKGKVTEKQQQYMQDLYHGDASGHISHVSMLVNGKGKK
jgi:hypothetical protein